MTLSNPRPYEPSQMFNLPRLGTSPLLTILFTALICLISFLPQTTHAQDRKKNSSSSIIVEAEGMACLGQDRTRTQAQKLALDAAKMNASEKVSTYVSRETQVVKGRLNQDILDVFSRAEVKVVDELEKGWIESKEQSGFPDSCYRIRIKAEVIPAEGGAPESSRIDNPRAPLNVELWTDKDEYRFGDKLKFYFRGNKPFYARAVYKDADGNLIEITPYRQSRYYQGGVIHEIPGHNDSFTLLITPPIGQEKLLFYASTVPLTQYAGSASGPFYAVKGSPQQLGRTTRGLTVLKETAKSSNSAEAEFAEVEVEVKVGK